MLLSKLLCGLQYSLPESCTDIEITTPVTDSREASKGSMFICIDGTRRRGADFASDALKRGAVVFVAEYKVSGAPTVIVPDARRAAAVIWHNFFGRPAESMRLYGVTGTNGKTSTAAFLYSILRASGRKAGIIGTLGCFADGATIQCRGAETTDIPAAMTTPDPKYLYSVLSEMKKMGIEDAVIEVSSHSLLQKKVDPLVFEAAVFTNLSSEHLDCHGDMETYFRVKASLFEKGKCKKAILNGDDIYAKRLDGITVGREAVSEVDTTGKTAYVLTYKGERIPLTTPVCGSFTVYNSMLAAVCALEVGIPAESVKKGVSLLEGVSGRMERVAEREKYGFDVYIDYAHTPAAMESALAGFDNDGRITVLFGCGGDRDKAKRAQMGEIACRLADRVIITSDNPRSEDRLAIIKDILRGIPDIRKHCCVVIPSRHDAICYALETARENECIFLLGKGHETWETLKDKKVPFCEKTIVEELLKRKFGK